MSSPQNSLRTSIPPPRRESPHPTSSAGHGTPRSSFDHGQNTGSYSHGLGESSTSRRPSQSSVHHSPASVHSSRNGHVVGGGAGGSGGLGNGTANGGGGGGGVAQRLPRITTTNHYTRGPASEDGGPRSAPLNGPLKPPHDGIHTGPLRSASSPDPWLSSHNTTNPSPTNSPNESRHPPSSLVLGPAFPVPHRRPSGGKSGNITTTNNNTNPSPPSTHPSPNPNVPPRKSSHHPTESRTITPQNSHPSLYGSLAGGGGGGGGGGQSETSGGQSGVQGESGSVEGGNSQGQSSSREGAGQGLGAVRSKRGEPTCCGQCGQIVHGQFVRAMSKVFHLNCFRCKDCNKVVAQKFFPVEDVEGMYPLCERDYFARLDLICGKCDQALRSSYITACGNKYHVEHFTCTECDVLFGPNDSYYEHAGKVYCHFHYSTQFAVKCVGCETAILKQFVEMNRNGRDECWHPECYMISKFWNVRLASKNFNTPSNSAVSSTVSLLEMTPTSGLKPSTSITSSPSPRSEIQMTPEELKERQEAMEMKVQQIWHVLSGYEESSAALIGDMLRAVNGRQLLDIILLAEKFILHVEVLFAVVDDLEAQFALAGVKGMSHAREAKQLCRKLVNLFSTMSQISPHGGAPLNTQELFTLITQLAHYLKILIRIALTGSIKLERDHGNPTAMTNCLARLNLLAMDGGDPTIKKRGDYPEIIPGTVNTPRLTVNDKETPTTPGEDEQLKKSIDALTRRPQGYISSTQMIAYGYRSLALEVTGETTLRGPQSEDFIPPEGCTHCRTAIEEDCIRLGMFNRWHSACIICLTCGDKAIVLVKDGSDEGSREESSAKLIRKPPPRVDDFFYEKRNIPPETILCVNHKTQTCVDGFKSVSRLEQYTFLLHIALRRLYVHFRTHHDLPSVRDRPAEDVHAGRELEVKRMKSVTLDRKLSSTARLPQRSTVVESPAGRMADANGQVVSARSSTALGPLQVPTETYGGVDDDDEGPQSAVATVDVIRPPFARNNTNVMIINESLPDHEEDFQHTLIAPTITREDDAITLGDIPLLADQTIHERERLERDGRPLMSELNQLQGLILKHFALLQLQKSSIGHLIELDEVLELLEVRKNQWWNKIFKGNNKKDQKKKGVFGVPIEILVERTGSDSQQGASNAQLRVPEFIEDIISTMRQMDMAVEGIFRKNGNIRRLQQISEALDKDTTTVNLSEENPVQLAALLKRFLREMPDPLLTFRLHKLFCGAASIQQPEDRERCLHLLITLLPRYNRDTMEVLFVFLRWVGTFSYRDEETGSRMDMANLATVICPSILYAKGANAARDESFIGIQAVQELLERQDEFYRVPAELTFVITEGIYTIFAKELDLPPKEIHRHCSKYMQARRPGQTPPVQGGGGMRDRPSDGRLSVHRSEGNLAGTAEGTGQMSGLPSSGTLSGSPFRAPPPPPPQHASGQSRPTSWAERGPINSPSNGGGGWRGPFHAQGVKENGSRNSSRGSAPSSPGPEGGRGSMTMERERSWTPVQEGSGLVHR